jgi:uncharacterized glyoxalase superfamily protein PhnB
MPLQGSRVRHHVIYNRPVPRGGSASAGWERPYLPSSLAGRQTEVTRAHSRCVHMTTFASVTPNLIVRDIARSTAFYCEVLGFTVRQTVPDTAPHVFVWLERDGVPVFLNDAAAADADYPGASARPAGGTATLFFAVTEVDRLHERVASHARVVMPLKTQFYGMREFAIEDPDAHILTFAERVSE